MPALLYLVCLAPLAYLLQTRVALLAGFRGVPRFLLSLGLTLFLVSWANFLLFAACGWGIGYQAGSWAIVLVPSVLLSEWRQVSADPREWWRKIKAELYGNWRRNLLLLCFGLLVLPRFYMGLEIIDGEVFCNFNFLDTAFHLSVANAFVFASKFPPMDLDMAPFPLKYHFLADFFVAHLIKLGLTRVPAMWTMNMLSATVLVGALWAMFERWLNQSARWIFLAGVIFLFLNTSLPNLIHYWIYQPGFFNPAAPFEGVIRYYFYNFESIMSNILEPQRGFLFTPPIGLLIMNAAFGSDEPCVSGQKRPVCPNDPLLQAWLLICLMPLAHIVTFAVLGVAAAPKLWSERTWFFSRWRWWSPFLALCLLQLWYILFYAPPPNSGFPSFFLKPLLPAAELSSMPQIVRRTVFWLWVNGDFLIWGLLFASTAIFYRPMRQFISQWRWYFFSCIIFFLFINFYSFPFQWGDNNKFVLFLNLGLTMVITLGAAQWIGQRAAWRSHLLWWFFFTLCVAPHAYDFYKEVFLLPKGKILLFQKNSRAAALWLRENTEPAERVLTAAADIDQHFVTALSGRPTPAGIYSYANVYRQDERIEAIRRVYEECDLSALPQLEVEFVCLSRVERRTYKINSCWQNWSATGTAVVFQSGNAVEFDSVFLFDASELPKR